MKILVISDTHGYIGNAVEAIENEKCDFCIHLGDMAADCEELELIFPRQRFIFVKGNNDFFVRGSQFPDERVFELGGKKFFVCHGHKYHVKSGLFALKKKAAEEGADIVLYGHTHRSFLETEPVLIMNPGASLSYGVITINDGKIESRLCEK
ncbi:MAG: metallophosphoesterase [Clostridia bacterium]|nr:metallophosphoesterase [Clostridia bacterium]